MQMLLLKSNSGMQLRDALGMCCLETGEGLVACVGEVSVFVSLDRNQVGEMLHNETWERLKLACFSVGRLARYFFFGRCR